MEPKVLDEILKKQQMGLMEKDKIYGELTENIQQAYAEATPKRGRGRPRKDGLPVGQQATKAKKPQYLPLGFLQMPAKIIFDTVFLKFNRTPLTEQEASAIDKSLTPVLNKYGDSVLERWAEELGFILVLLPIVTARALEKPKEDDKNEATAQGQI